MWNWSRRTVSERCLIFNICMARWGQASRRVIEFTGLVLIYRMMRHGILSVIGILDGAG